MKLKLLLNIGAPDARRLGLTSTLAGETVDAKDDVSKELLTRGWATDKLDDNKPTPAAAPKNSAETPDPAVVAGRTSVVPEAPKGTKNA